MYCFLQKNVQSIHCQKLFLLIPLLELVNRESDQLAADPFHFKAFLPGVLMMGGLCDGVSNAVLVMLRFRTEGHDDLLFLILA
jgi:hypothetical protein